MFVTLFYAVFNPANGLLTYSNGGHNPPVIIHADGTSTILPVTNGVALGVAPGWEYDEAAAPLAPGETIILYTDGVTEAMNAEGEEFGLDRLRQVLGESVPPAQNRQTRLSLTPSEILPATHPSLTI